MALFLARRWRQQPQYPVAINRGNVITSGLGFVWTGAFWNSPALGTATPQSGFLNGGGIVQDTFGRGVRTTEATANKSLIETTTFSTAEMSYLLFGRFPTVAGSGGIWRDYVAASNGSGSVVLEMVATGTSPTIGAMGFVGVGTWSTASGAFGNISVLGRAVSVVATVSVASNRLAVLYDGAVQATSTWNFTQNATTSRLFGDPARGTVRDPAMTCAALFARWNRALSDAEALELNENPWQIFVPAANQTFYSFARTPSPKFKISADWQQDVLQTRYGTLPEGDTSSISDNFEAWNKLSDLLQKHKKAGQLYTNPVISTYSLVFTSASTAFHGGVLSAQRELHMAPVFSNVGQKISITGVVSTYTTLAQSYYGGVLSRNGIIHFFPGGSSQAQTVSASNIVSTYPLVHTTVDAFRGGVLAPNGDIHFVPGSARVGQKTNPSNVVSTYPLVYTTTNAYEGGVLAPNGDIHFVPFNAPVGQKINTSGSVSTYPLVHTKSLAYNGGALDMNGNIHFIPHDAEVGQMVSIDGVVSTYSLVYTTAGAYVGGVLAPNGDIHFVPSNAVVGQKISDSGVVSTYSLPYTTTVAYRGGVLMTNDEIHFIPARAARGMKLMLNSGEPFDVGVCLSPFFNKF